MYPVSDENRNQPPGASQQDDPPPSPGNSRGLISELVSRLDFVRDTILDENGDEDWEETRTRLDRELRAIQLELAALCPPA